MKPLITLLAASAFFSQLGASLNAQSTFTSANDHFAWGANFGWVDFRPGRPAADDGVRVTDTHLGGYAWSANTGWIDFGDGAPANEVRYANTNGGDFGVNHDGGGNLSGLAWSANLGWINFGWAGAGVTNRPRFDIQTGQFTGYAWSANAGWINLSTGLLRTDSIAITDSDGDGISDAWEREKAGNLTTLTGTGDADGDGVTDRNEYVSDTNPLVPGGGLRIVRMSRDAALHESEVEWTSRPTRLYTLWEDTNLSSNIWNSRSTLPGASGATSASRVSANTPRGFYRVEVKLPLTP